MVRGHKCDLGLVRGWKLSWRKSRNKRHVRMLKWGRALFWGTWCHEGKQREKTTSGRAYEVGEGVIKDVIGCTYLHVKEREQKEKSVQFSRSVVSDSLRPHESQHARPPCPSPKLPEFTQTHVHQVSDAIQPSHPLSSPSTPALNPSQHQSLFQWVNSSHEVAKVLEFQL